MKIHFSVIAVILSLMILLSGCQKEDNHHENQQSIAAVTNDPRQNEQMVKLKVFSFDIDSDGKAESIELYVAAEQSGTGEILWDDGQKWLLVVVDEDRYYPLYSELLQLGRLYFNVATTDGKEMPDIFALLSAGAGLKIIRYTFDKERKVFQKEISYDSGAINRYYTSIPSY
jgi:hypothetical protein